MKLFLEKDQEQADKEQDCFGYSLQKAIEYYLQGEFKKAAINLENGARSVWELDRLKNTKNMHDEAWLILKQIEAKRQQEELLSRLKNEATR